MKISRAWAMPNSSTFSIEPIRHFVWKYLRDSEVSIDIFARDNRWATYTNDLNPATAAEYHMDALDFLRMLYEMGVKADLILFDPPYSLRQAKEVYEGIGIHFSHAETIRIGHWQEEKDLIDELLIMGGYVLSFGWNTIGMEQKRRGYEIEEILIVSHGRAHNDTLCMCEKKVFCQYTLDLSDFSDDKVYIKVSSSALTGT